MSGKDNVVADTNVTLFFLGGDKHLLDYFSKKEIHLSFITELELLSYGKMSDLEKLKVQKFLDTLPIYDIDEKIKNITIKIRQKYKLKLPDSIVVATAIRYNFPLIRADKKLFTIEEVKIIEYYV